MMTKKKILNTLVCIKDFIIYAVFLCFLFLVFLKACVDTDTEVSSNKIDDLVCMNKSKTL